MADKRIPLRARLLSPGGFALLAGLGAVLLVSPAPRHLADIAVLAGAALLVAVLAFAGVAVHAASRRRTEVPA